MTMRPFFPIALLVVLAGSGAAVAQTSECQRYRAELASLGRAATTGPALQQQHHEIGRLSAYYHSIGCGGGQFLFFSPPPECGAIAQRINTMQASYARMAASPESYGSESRRRQLRAAVQAACQPQEAAARRDDDDAAPRRLGGGRLVCVRACDGSFFPLHNLPDNGRSGADEMCKALCPGTETAAYSMPSDADADIGQAVSLRGKRYTKLAAAFKFRTSVDSSCSCRKEGQSWAEALQKAERMIDRGRNDIIVTAKKAEELSRPKLARKGKPAATPAEQPNAAQIAAAPRDVDTTGSIAPAEQGPDAVSGLDAAEKGDGEGGGAKRAVRIVGPTFISLPQAAE
ncbi:MAG TPA: DUF2865 domain-containing protein [Beijerinckiaceae bacterium]|nr:DUF2865 domain-containing protein [Beijerinckiaceae bacterium]